MFPPSREKIEAAAHYVAMVRSKVRGWKNTRGTSGHKRTGKILWHRLPAKWRPEADERLDRLIRKYWAEHGHGPSQQKYASLVGNVTQFILYRRATHRYISQMSRYRNALIALGTKFQPNPMIRTGFTPRTPKARASHGNLAGI